MLTRKQKELLNLIRTHLEEGGISPSFDEMRQALGLKSKSGIHRLITGLEERGFIRRLPHRARALEILRLPTEEGGADASVPQPENAAVQTLPLYGRIAAGTPIEALRNPQSNLEIPASLLASSVGKQTSTSHYALEVSGDSMIEAGIRHGDTVIIQSCDTAETGAIVVALIDEQEVTLKYLKKDGASILLKPANEAYETRRLPASRVKVQGRLVALMRRY